MAQPARASLQRSTSAGQLASRTQHAIPERLLTASQASALLSGLPPGAQAARLKLQGAFLNYTDAPDSIDTGSVLFIR